MKSILNKRAPSYVSIDKIIISGKNDLGEDLQIVKVFAPVILRNGDQLNIHWSLDVKQ